MAKEYRQKRTKAGMRCYEISTKMKPAPMAKCKGKKAAPKKSRARKSGTGPKKNARCISDHFKMRMGDRGWRCACVAQSNGWVGPRLIPMRDCRATGSPRSYKEMRRRFGPVRVTR